MTTCNQVYSCNFKKDDIDIEMFFRITRTSYKNQRIKTLLNKYFLAVCSNTEELRLFGYRNLTYPTVQKVLKMILKEII